MQGQILDFPRFRCSYCVTENVTCILFLDSREESVFELSETYFRPVDVNPPFKNYFVVIFQPFSF